MHVVIQVTFIPCMQVDLRLFLNILIFKTSHEKGIVDSSRDCFENGDDFNTFKDEFKYVIEKEGLG